MNNLEQELKCTLFLRSNKGIALTPEGRQLYEHVALAFEQLSIGEEEIRQNGELEHGLVSIGARRKCPASDPSGKAGAVPRAISPCSPAPL